MDGKGMEQKRKEMELQKGMEDEEMGNQGKGNGERGRKGKESCIREQI